MTSIITQISAGSPHERKEPENESNEEALSIEEEGFSSALSYYAKEDLASIRKVAQQHFTETESGNGILRGTLLSSRKKYTLLKSKESIYLLLNHGKVILGTGKYKKSEYALNLTTEEPVAVSVVRKKDHANSSAVMWRETTWEKIKEKIFKEISIQLSLADYHILPLLGSYNDREKEKIYLLTPLCKGTLAGLADEAVTTPQEALGLLRDIVTGVAILHNNNITHGDLHQENIFVHNEGVKIADFGNSSQWRREERYSIGSDCHIALVSDLTSVYEMGQDICEQFSEDLLLNQALKVINNFLSPSHLERATPTDLWPLLQRVIDSLPEPNDLQNLSRKIESLDLVGGIHGERSHFQALKQQVGSLGLSTQAKEAITPPRLELQETGNLFAKQEMLTMQKPAQESGLSNLFEKQELSTTQAPLQTSALGNLFEKQKLPKTQAPLQTSALGNLFEKQKLPTTQVPPQTSALGNLFEKQKLPTTQVPPQTSGLGNLFEKQEL